MSVQDSRSDAWRHTANVIEFLLLVLWPFSLWVSLSPAQGAGFWVLQVLKETAATYVNEMCVCMCECVYSTCVRERSRASKREREREERERKRRERENAREDLAFLLFAAS